MKTIDINFEDRSYPVVYALTDMEDGSLLFDIVVKDEAIATHTGSEFNFTLSKNEWVPPAEIYEDKGQRLKYDIIRTILVAEDLSSFNG